MTEPKTEIAHISTPKAHYTLDFGSGTLQVKPIMTNADRIRSMTDEELANFVSLCCGWTCAECPVGKEYNGDECFSTWLDWLK